MPRFITDPIVEAYMEMLNSSVMKFADVPDIEDVLSDSNLDCNHRALLNECQSEIDSTCRYLTELAIPEIANKIRNLPCEVSPSVKKHLSTSIIKILESI
jgi:hypothetical protein